MTRNEHETGDGCADLLKDIRGEKETRWVFRDRQPALRAQQSPPSEPAIRLPGSHSVRLLAASHPKTIGQTGAIVDLT